MRTEKSTLIKATTAVQTGYRTLKPRTYHADLQYPSPAKCVKV